MNWRKDAGEIEPSSALGMQKIAISYISRGEREDNKRWNPEGFMTAFTKAVNILAFPSNDQKIQSQVLDMFKLGFMSVLAGGHHRFDIDQIREINQSMQTLKSNPVIDIYKEQVQRILKEHEQSLD